MRAREDRSAKLSAKQAKSPEVINLFIRLADRATSYAQMENEFWEILDRNRESRTGKPSQLTKHQQRTLERFERDADEATKELEHQLTRMDDKSLLISSITNENMLIETDLGMAETLHPEDKELAHRLIDFRRETVRLIEEFIESSEFADQVASIWRSTNRTN